MTPKHSRKQQDSNHNTPTSQPTTVAEPISAMVTTTTTTTTSFAAAANQVTVDGASQQCVALVDFEQQAQSLIAACTARSQTEALPKFALKNSGVNGWPAALIKPFIATIASCIDENAKTVTACRLILNNIEGLLTPTRAWADRLVEKRAALVKSPIPRDKKQAKARRAQIKFVENEVQCVQGVIILLHLQRAVLYFNQAAAVFATADKCQAASQSIVSAMKTCIGEGLTVLHDIAQLVRLQLSAVSAQQAEYNDTQTFQKIVSTLSHKIKIRLLMVIDYGALSHADKCEINETLMRIQEQVSELPDVIILGKNQARHHLAARIALREVIQSLMPNEPSYQAVIPLQRSGLTYNINSDGNCPQLTSGRRDFIRRANGCYQLVERGLDTLAQAIADFKAHSEAQPQAGDEQSDTHFLAEQCKKFDEIDVLLGVQEAALKLEYNDWNTHVVYQHQSMVCLDHRRFLQFLQRLIKANRAFFDALVAYVKNDIQQVMAELNEAEEYVTYEDIDSYYGLMLSIKMVRFLFLCEDAKLAAFNQKLMRNIFDVIETLDDNPLMPPSDTIVSIVREDLSSITDYIAMIIACAKTVPSPGDSTHQWWGKLNTALQSFMDEGELFAKRIAEDVVQDSRYAVTVLLPEQLLGRDLRGDGYKTVSNISQGVGSLTAACEQLNRYLTYADDALATHAASIMEHCDSVLLKIYQIHFGLKQLIYAWSCVISQTVQLTDAEGVAEGKAAAVPAAGAAAAVATMTTTTTAATASNQCADLPPTLLSCMMQLSSFFRVTLAMLEEAQVELRRLVHIIHQFKISVTVFQHKMSDEHTQEFLQLHQALLVALADGWDSHSKLISLQQDIILHRNTLCAADIRERLQIFEYGLQAVIRMSLFSSVQGIACQAKLLEVFAKQLTFILHEALEILRTQSTLAADNPKRDRTLLNVMQALRRRICQLEQAAKGFDQPLLVTDCCAQMIEDVNRLSDALQEHEARLTLKAIDACSVMVNHALDVLQAVDVPTQDVQLAQQMLAAHEKMLDAGNRLIAMGQLAHNSMHVAESVRIPLVSAIDNTVTYLDAAKVVLERMHATQAGAISVRFEKACFDSVCMSLKLQALQFKLNAAISENQVAHSPVSSENYRASCASGAFILLNGLSAMTNTVTVLLASRGTAHETACTGEFKAAMLFLRGALAGHLKRLFILLLQASYTASDVATPVVKASEVTLPDDVRCAAEVLLSRFQTLARHSQLSPQEKLDSITLQAAIVRFLPRNRFFDNVLVAHRRSSTPTDATAPCLFHTLAISALPANLPQEPCKQVAILKQCNVVTEQMHRFVESLPTYFNALLLPELHDVQRLFSVKLNTLGALVPPRVGILSFAWVVFDLNDNRHYPHTFLQQSYKAARAQHLLGKALFGLYLEHRLLALSVANAQEDFPITATAVIKQALRECMGELATHDDPVFVTYCITKIINALLLKPLNARAIQYITTFLEQLYHVLCQTTEGLAVLLPDAAQKMLREMIDAMYQAMHVYDRCEGKAAAAAEHDTAQQHEVIYYLHRLLNRVDCDYHQSMLTVSVQMQACRRNGFHATTPVMPISAATTTTTRVPSAPQEEKQFPLTQHRLGYRCNDAALAKADATLATLLSDLAAQQQAIYKLITSCTIDNNSVVKRKKMQDARAALGKANQALSLRAQTYGANQKNNALVCTFTVSQLDDRPLSAIAYLNHELTVLRLLNVTSKCLMHPTFAGDAYISALRKHVAISRNSEYSALQQQLAMDGCLKMVLYLPRLIYQNAAVKPILIEEIQLLADYVQSNDSVNALPYREYYAAIQATSRALKSDDDSKVQRDKLTGALKTLRTCLFPHEELAPVEPTKQERQRTKQEAARAKAHAAAQAKRQAAQKAKQARLAREQAEAKARAEAEVKVKALAAAKARAEAKTKARAEAKAKAQADAKAQAKAKVQARARAESKARAEAKARAKIKAQADAHDRFLREHEVPIAQASPRPRSCSAPPLPMTDFIDNTASVKQMMFYNPQQRAWEQLNKTQQQQQCANEYGAKGSRRDMSIGGGAYSAGGSSAASGGASAAADTAIPVVAPVALFSTAPAAASVVTPSVASTVVCCKTFLKLT